MIPQTSTRAPFCIRCNQTGVRLLLRNMKHRIGICESCVQPGETDQDATNAIARYIKDARTAFAESLLEPKGESR